MLFWISFTRQSTLFREQLRWYECEDFFTLIESHHIHKIVVGRSLSNSNTAQVITFKLPVWVRKESQELLVLARVLQPVF